MTEKWWPEYCDGWAKQKIKEEIGDQVMIVLSCMHQYYAGRVAERHLVAHDAAILYWIEVTTRQCAQIFGQEVPGYARKD